LADLVLTVYLGKTGGILDDAKNTATLVAEAIDQVSEFTAVMTGSGGVMLVTVEPAQFTGGIAIVDVVAGSRYEVSKKLAVVDAQNEALNDILEQLEMGNAPSILRNTGKTPPVGVVLGSGDLYEQPSIDRPNQNIPVGQTRIWVYADQNGLLVLKESHNGVNWTTLSSINVSAGITNIMGWTKLTKRYVKIAYTNGAVAQTEFILLQYFLGVGVTLVKVDDGDIVSLGNKGDALIVDPLLSASLIALSKGIMQYLKDGKFTPIDIDGNAFFTDSKPGSMKLTGRTVANDPVASRLTNGADFLASVSGHNDGLGHGGALLTIVTDSYLSNGVTWDRQRGNTDGILLASAARTATAASPNQINYNARGVMVTLRVTAVSGTGLIQLKIWGINPVTGSATAGVFGATASITTTGDYTLEVYPGASGGSTASGITFTNAALPRSWKVEIYHSDTSSYTYSVGYSLII